MAKAYRQGDVLLVKVETMEPLKESSTSEVKVVSVKDAGKTLREGEVTGHAHRLSTDSKARLVEQHETEKDKWGGMKNRIRRFLQVEGDTRLEHEEHGLITPEPGLYEVIAQREYTGEESRPRSVKD